MIPNHWNTLRPMHQKELDRTLVVEFTIDAASAKVRNVGVNDEPEDYELPIWAGVIPTKQIMSPPISDEKLNKGIEVPTHILEFIKKQQN